MAEASLKELAALLKANEEAMDTDNGEAAVPEIIGKHATGGRYRANREDWTTYIEGLHSWAQEQWDAAERFLNDTTELHCVLYDKV